MVLAQVSLFAEQRATCIVHTKDGAQRGVIVGHYFPSVDQAHALRVRPGSDGALDATAERVDGGGSWQVLEDQGAFNLVGGRENAQVDSGLLCRHGCGRQSRREVGGGRLWGGGRGRVVNVDVAFVSTLGGRAHQLDFTLECAMLKSHGPKGVVGF